MIQIIVVSKQNAFQHFQNFEIWTSRQVRNVQNNFGHRSEMVRPSSDRLGTIKNRSYDMIYYRSYIEDICTMIKSIEKARNPFEKAIGALCIGAQLRGRPFPVSNHLEGFAEPLDLRLTRTTMSKALLRGI